MATYRRPRAVPLLAALFLVAAASAVRAPERRPARAAAGTNSAPNPSHDTTSRATTAGSRADRAPIGGRARRSHGVH